jgi:hypothetical protein
MRPQNSYHGMLHSIDKLPFDICNSLPTQSLKASILFHHSKKISNGMNTSFLPYSMKKRVALLYGPNKPFSCCILDIDCIGTGGNPAMEMIAPKSAASLRVTMKSVRMAAP